MVSPLASTGNDRRRRTAVITTPHAKRGNLEYVIPFVRMFITVTIKLIAPSSDEIPEICSEKITISTLGPECDWILERGGYTVHPVPGPVSTSVEATASRSDGTRSQKLMLLSLARLISALPSIRGTR